MAAIEMTDHPFTEFAAGSDVVTVFAPQSAHATWHVTDFCRGLDRHRGRGLIRCQDDAASVAQNMFSDRRTPCLTCAMPVLLRFGLRTSAGDPDSRDVVLGCPAPRFGTDGNHGGCRRCRDLQRLADEFGLTGHCATGGYRLIAGRVSRAARWPFAHLYAYHEVPAGTGPLTPQLLATAWALRTPADLVFPVSPYRDPRGELTPLVIPNFELATLVTADVAGDL